MIKLFNLLKSSGAFVIYFWLTTTFVGLFFWFVTPSLMNSVTKSDSEMYILLNFVIWLFKPVPVIVFIVFLIITILITISWLKDKGSSKRK
jgi:hypothetical protein